jgi:hypothetical protein
MALRQLSLLAQVIHEDGGVIALYPAMLLIEGALVQFALAAIEE